MDDARVLRAAGATMQFRQLRYFVKIVEAGSLSRAASVVHVAQPALSQQVAELEERFGVELLQRSARGVRPTAAGTVLYKEAVILLRLLDRLSDITSLNAADPEGTVNLGLDHILSSKLVGGILDESHKRLRKVVLRMSDDDRAGLEQKVSSGILDIAILFDDEVPMPLTREPLFTQKLYLVSQQELPNHTSVVSRETVAELPLVLPGPTNSRRRLIERAFAQSNLTLNVVVESEPLGNAVWVLLNNAGYGIMGIGDASHFGPTTFKKPLMIDPPIYLTCSIVRSADVPLTHAGQAAYDFLVDYIARRVEQPDMAGAEWIGKAQKKKPGGVAASVRRPVI